MDTSASSWFSELGFEDPLFSTDQYDIMDFFDEDLSAALGEDFQCSLSQECNSSTTTLIPRSNSTTTLCASSPNVEPQPPQVNVEIRPAKQHKAYNIDRASPSPVILSFGNSNAQENIQQVTIGTLNPEDDAVSEVLMSQGSYANLVNFEEAATKTPKKTPRTRPPSQTYDHIIAERKRREQLSSQFVALSAIVPGLKKMDKTSVLGDAIKYLKHLQERVKTLEEQAAKQTVESMVLVKKSQILDEDEGSSDEQNCFDEQPLPEIEAKVSDKHVLMRIQCEKDKGVLVKVLSIMHNLNLAVTNTNVTPFGSLALDITIIAEMGNEFNLTTTELVKSLRSALKRIRQTA